MKYIDYSCLVSLQQIHITTFSFSCSRLNNYNEVPKKTMQQEDLTSAVTCMGLLKDKAHWPQMYRLR